MTSDREVCTLLHGMTSSYKVHGEQEGDHYVHLSVHTRPEELHRSPEIIIARGATPVKAVDKALQSLHRVIEGLEAFRDECVEEEREGRTWPKEEDAFYKPLRGQPADSIPGQDI